MEYTFAIMPPLETRPYYVTTTRGAYDSVSDFDIETVMSPNDNNRKHDVITEVVYRTFNEPARQAPQRGFARNNEQAPQRGFARNNELVPYYYTNRDAPKAQAAVLPQQDIRMDAGQLCVMAKHTMQMYGLTTFPALWKKVSSMMSKKIDDNLTWQHYFDGEHNFLILSSS